MNNNLMGAKVIVHLNKHQMGRSELPMTEETKSAYKWGVNTEFWDAEGIFIAPSYYSDSGEADTFLMVKVSTGRVVEVDAERIIFMGDEA